MDEHNPVVTMIIKGKEVTDTMIDGGSGVNVISGRMCNTLAIREWETCPFWLQMADTSSVRPTRLNLEITIGGHAFRIFLVVLQLNAPGVCTLYYKVDLG